MGLGHSLLRPFRPFRPSRPGTMPAGLVLMVVLGAMLIAMVGNADSTLRKSDGKASNAQWRKDVAKDVAAVADALHLTAPRREIDSAMGRSDAKGPTLDQLVAEQAATNGAVPDTSGGSTVTTADLAALSPKLRTPTADNPLRLWVGGDSVSQTFGTQLIRVAEGTGLFKGTLDFHLGTGLAVPSYFNWPEHFVKDIVPTNPDVIVTSFGTNDGQNIQTDDGKVLQRFSPEWYDEYQKRVGQTMDLLKSPTNDRVIIWCTPPPMGPTTGTHGMDRITYIGWLEAKTRPWVHFCDTWSYFSDANGQFQHSLLMADGQVRGLRQKDDIHMSDIGGTLLGWVVIDDLRAYGDLSTAKTAPKPSEVRPPDIKERTDVPQSMPGAI
jgi:hypothetical protein